jgi:hypothetical protein
MSRILLFALAFPVCAFCAGEFEQHVHEHGKVTFNVALEDQTLTIELDSPADNVIGFEHPPRTQAQRTAVRDMAAWLQSGRGLFAFSPAAACRFTAAELHAPQWNDQDKHADYEARFTYRCAQPGELKWMQLRLLPKLHAVQEAHVNLLTATRQASETVKGADERVRLR